MRADLGALFQHADGDFGRRAASGGWRRQGRRGRRRRSPHHIPWPRAGPVPQAHTPVYAFASGACYSDGTSRDKPPFRTCQTHQNDMTPERPPPPCLACRDGRRRDHRRNAGEPAWLAADRRAASGASREPHRSAAAGAANCQPLHRRPACARSDGRDCRPPARASTISWRRFRPSMPAR